MKAGLCLWAAPAVIATLALAQDREWEDAMARAKLAETTGDFTEELAQARRAEALAERFPPGDKRIWGTYNTLGIAYQEAGFNAEAIHTHKRELALIQTGLGTDNATYALALANLATVYIMTGDLPSAVSKLRESLRIQMKHPDTPSECIAETQSRLADALLVSGRRDEPERLIGLALPVLRDGDPVERAVALNNLGFLRRWQHRYAEAIQLVLRSIADLEQVYGPEHPLLLRSLNNLAVLDWLTDQNGEADAAFQRAMAISEKKLPRDHPAYAGLLANYAVFLRKTGEKARAKAMEQQSRSLLRDQALRDGRSLTVDVSAFRHP